MGTSSARARLSASMRAECSLQGSEWSSWESASQLWHRPPWRIPVGPRHYHGARWREPAHAPGLRRPCPHGRRQREGADRALRPRPRGGADVARSRRARRRAATRRRATWPPSRGSPAIQAAKRTDELIPLAHSLPLTHVDAEIAIDPDAGTVTVVAEARTTDRTGVEMEALVACSVAR